MRFVLVAVTVLVLTAATSAQNTPRFDVASIRPNRSGDGGAFFQVLPGGRYLAINATALELVLAAYEFEYQPFQVFGGEPWMRTERFNVDARAGREVPPPEVVAMLPALMADRFALVMRREVRQMPVYVLLRAGTETTAASRMKSATGECAVVQLGQDGAPVPPPADAPQCGLRYASSPVVGLEGSHVTIQQLSRRLVFYLQRAVVDETGLNGMFAMDLEFADPRRPVPANASDAGVSIFTAVQEQLGLRLEPRTGPVDVLVIERAQRPTEN